MTTGTKGIALIQSFEQCRLKAYQDEAGIWTIGWGNTQYETGISVRRGDTITQDHADKLFRTILSRFETSVTVRVKSNLNQNQFDALVSFTYNCGVGNFDKSMLLKRVNANPSDATIRDAFAMFKKSGGHVSNGLVRRRKAEADLYFTPIS